MKYVVLVGDGMADEPIAELDDKTPLEVAHCPHMDQLTSQAKVFGLAKTIPDGFEPGSDVGNMSILGYNPDLYYTGRAPIEAASMGIELTETDVALRCNLVKLVEDEGELIMEDYSAGHIETDEAHRLISLLQPVLEDESFQLFPGVSYRHLIKWRHGKRGLRYTPPHNIPGRPIKSFLPAGDGHETLLDLIDRSQEILDGQQANSIWLWGAGVPPHLPTLTERFGITGAVISAVDLVKGLGMYAGLEVIEVEGATGYLDTNYSGKVDATLEALKRHDLVYLHVEAPDETGHEGDFKKKIQAIEDLDSKVVGPLLNGLSEHKEVSILLMPDHPTPVDLRTHTSDPVPFLIYRSNELESNSERVYTEKSAESSGTYRPDAHELMPELLRKLAG